MHHGVSHQYGGDPLTAGAHPVRLQWPASSTAATFVLVTLHSSVAQRSRVSSFCDSSQPRPCYLLATRSCYGPPSLPTPRASGPNLGHCFDTGRPRKQHSTGNCTAHLGHCFGEDQTLLVLCEEHPHWIMCLCNERFPTLRIVWSKSLQNYIKNNVALTRGPVHSSIGEWRTATL